MFRKKMYPLEKDGSPVFSSTLFHSLEVHSLMSRSNYGNLQGLVGKFLNVKEEKVPKLRGTMRRNCTILIRDKHLLFSLQQIVPAHAGRLK